MSNRIVCLMCLTLLFCVSFYVFAERKQANTGNSPERMLQLHLSTTGFSSKMTLVLEFFRNRERKKVSLQWVVHALTDKNAKTKAEQVQALLGYSFKGILTKDKLKLEHGCWNIRLFAKISETKGFQVLRSICLTSEHSDIRLELFFTSKGTYGWKRVLPGNKHVALKHKGVAAKMIRTQKLRFTLSNKTKQAIFGTDAAGNFFGRFQHWRKGWHPFIRAGRCGTVLPGKPLKPGQSTESTAGYYIGEIKPLLPGKYRYIVRYATRPWFRVASLKKAGSWEHKTKEKSSTKLKAPSQGQKIEPIPIYYTVVFPFHIK